MTLRVTPAQGLSLVSEITSTCGNGLAYVLLVLKCRKNLCIVDLQPAR